MLSAEYPYPPHVVLMMQPVPASPVLFTVGHSNQALADFLSLLVKHGVKTLGDVRSRPGSFRFPQFNRESLESALAAADIRYEFLGAALGGRPTDARAYRADGSIDYARRRKAPDFIAGIDRLIELVRADSIAILCAEEDPLHCHRFLMICPALMQRGVTPQHIRRGGALETQRETEDRLLTQHGFQDVTSTSLFPSDRDSALEDALRRQAEEYAFRTSPESIESF